MRQILVLISGILFLTHSNLRAQDSSFEGRIVYTHVSDGMEMMDYNYRINESGFRLNRKFVSMIDRPLPEILFVVSDSSWVQIEHAEGKVKYLKPQPVEDSKQSTIKPLDESEMYMGYLCDKYEVETWVSFENRMSKSIYWVARDLKVSWAEEVNELTKGAEFMVRAANFTKGLSLKIEMLDSKGRVKSTVSAVSILPQEIDEDFLAIPTQGYEIEGK